MKRFSEFLNEIQLFNTSKDKSDFDGHHSSIGKLISITPSGHHIFRNDLNTHRAHEKFSNFHAVNPETRKVDMHLRTISQKHPNGQETHNVEHLVGGKNSTIKAHELYNHLIKNHGIILHSDTMQSTGGLKVWKKLHKTPGVHVHKWDKESNKASSTSRVGLGYTHSRDSFANSVTRSTLVAHKE